MTPVPFLHRLQETECSHGQRFLPPTPHTKYLRPAGGGGGTDVSYPRPQKWLLADSSSPQGPLQNIIHLSQRTVWIQANALRPSKSYIDLSVCAVSSISMIIHSQQTRRGTCRPPQACHGQTKTSRLKGENRYLQDGTHQGHRTWCQRKETGVEKTSRILTSGPLP